MREAASDPRPGRLRAAPVALAVCAALVVASITAAGAGVRPRSGTASVIAADVNASLSIQSLPTSLSPPLSTAQNDTALVDTPALSNCNVTTGGVNPSECIFGDKSGSHTMVLWGDSHAFMWFPAVNAIAKAAHWRLLALMEFGCPVADISVWNTLTDTPYTGCNVFRTKMISIINKMKPSLVIMTEQFTAYAASAHGVNYTISVGQWQTALEKTLHLLKVKKLKKVVLGSTVSTGGASPVACLAAHSSDVQACTLSDTSAQQAQRAAEAAAAKAASATYVNVLPWLCSSSVTPLACSPVIGDTTNGWMIAYYAAGHLTETYALFLSGVLGTALKRSMR
jgi:SGNH domain-containing protein